MKTYCKCCGHEANHVIKASHKAKPYKDEEAIVHYNEYSIIECLGCGFTSFLHEFWDTDFLEDDGTPYRLTNNYPEDPDRFNEYEFLSEEDQEELPKVIETSYNDLEIALKNEADLLAGVGLRMVVEAVCKHKKISGRDLKKKISNLLELGLISKVDFEIIDKLREIGNISAHQIKSPSQSRLYGSLEAVNHLLRTVYVVPKRTKQLLRTKKKGQ